jgi:hypothetical protein
VSIFKSEIKFICNWMVVDFWYSVQSGFSCVAVYLLLLDLFCANIRYKIILYVCRYDKVIIICLAVATHGYLCSLCVCFPLLPQIASYVHIAAPLNLAT